MPKFTKTDSYENEFPMGSWKNSCYFCSPRHHSHINIITNCIPITILSHDSSFRLRWCIIFLVFNFSVMWLRWWVCTFTNTTPSRSKIQVCLSRWWFFWFSFVHSKASISILRLNLKSFIFFQLLIKYIFRYIYILRRISVTVSLQFIITRENGNTEAV